MDVPWIYKLGCKGRIIFSICKLVCEIAFLTEFRILTVIAVVFLPLIRIRNYGALEYPGVHIQNRGKEW
jgi:hypothetical protein